MQLADRVSAWASAAAVTVQVFTITMSADAEPLAATKPRSRSWRSIGRCIRLGGAAAELLDVKLRH